MNNCLGKRKIKFMTGILSMFAVAGLLCGAKAKSEKSNEDFLAKADVIPTPKSIVLTKKGVLLSSKDNNDALIIIGHDNVKRLEAAAKAINDRIKILGGKALPVIKDSDYTPDKGKGKNLILLGNRESNKITADYWIYQGKIMAASMPPEQGYIIKTLLHRTSWGGSIFVLAGTDSIGTYYAAATFRQLIHKKNDKIIGVTASVRDWPDRKKRMIWGRNAREKDDMEYWALYKSTGISCGFTPLYLVDRKPPFNVSEKAKGTIAKLKFGNTIGFRYNALVSPDLASKRFSFTYSNKPYKEILKEWNGSVVHGGHLFSWSHEKELRARFRAISKGLKAGEFDFLSVHLPDTDPSNYWPDRSPSCKKKWGDDFQSWCDAQAWLINLMREEIRKLNPDQKIVYIFRPYTSTTIDDVKWRWDLTVKTLLEKMPFDDKSYILVREDIPSRIEAWRKKWNNMKQFYYIEILPARPSPLFAGMSKMLGTFMNYSPDDIVWPITYRVYPDPVNVLMTLERQWNRNSNGPGLYPRNKMDFYLKNNKPSTPEEKDLLLRVCRNIFGYEAGANIVDVYASGISPDLAANPMNYKNIYNISDLKPHLEKNLVAARKSYSAVKKTLDENIPIKEEGKRFFPLMYRVALTTLALAEAQHSIFAAKELIASGNEKEADKIIREGLENLQKRKEELDLGDKTFKDWPPSLNMKDDGHKTWKDLLIETPGMRGAHQDCSAGARVAAEEAAMKGLLNDKEIVKAEFAAKKASEKIASTPMPVVVAKKADTPPVIDGKPDDEAWRNAVWQGNFVRHNRLLYSRVPAEVAVSYDDKNIYLFFKSKNSGKSSPVDIDKEMDKWSSGNEYVEAFLAPDIKDGYYQLFFSRGGTLGDLRAFMPESKGGLYQAQSEAEAKAEGLETAHPKPMTDNSWNSTVDWKVFMDKDSWNLEAAIPVESLKVKGKDVKIKKGDKWHVNFCRSIPRSGMYEAEYSSLNRGDYGAYWKFPVMKFE